MKNEKIHKRLGRDQVLTVPNLMSLFRLLLVPLLFIFTFGGEWERWRLFAVFAVVVVSALTDVVDGFIARKYHCVSDLGKLLDPVADKLTQFSLMLCLGLRLQFYPLLGLLGFQILKECAMFIAGCFILKNTDTVNSARWYGKVTTVVLYASMLAILLFPMPKWALALIVVFCAFWILFSLVMYLLYYRKLILRARMKASAPTGETRETEEGT